LGRGKFLDQNGYVNGFELFNRHLYKVGKICERYNLKPMIWSDMYFRLGSKIGCYYDVNSTIPPEVVREIPKDVQLVYWDYYHNDKDFYVNFIEKHRKLGPQFQRCDGQIDGVKKNAATHQQYVGWVLVDMTHKGIQRSIVMLVGVYQQCEAFLASVN
jgi:hypothetical protein